MTEELLSEFNVIEGSKECFENKNYTSILFAVEKHSEHQVPIIAWYLWGMT